VTSADWATVASLATALGTLVLAVATFSAQVVITTQVVRVAPEQEPHDGSRQAIRHLNRLVQL
jgi:hypothetical protein